MAILTGRTLNINRSLVESGEGTIVFRFEIDGNTIDKKVALSDIGNGFIVPRADGAGRVNNPDYRGFYLEGSSSVIVNDAAIANTGATTYIFLGGVSEPSRIDANDTLTIFGGIGTGTVGGVRVNFNKLFHPNAVGSVVTFAAGDIVMDRGSMIFCRALGTSADTITSGGDTASGATSVAITDTITASAGQIRLPLSRFARSITSVTINGGAAIAATDYSLLGAVLLYNGTALAQGDTVVISYMGDVFIKAGEGRFVLETGSGRSYLDSEDVNFPFVLEDNETASTIGGSYVVL